MSRAVVVLRHREDRDRVTHWARSAPWGTVVTFEEGKRTLPQNAKFWATVSDVARQATHNGKKYSTEVWRSLFMQAWGIEVKWIPSLDGDTMVPLMYRSSQLKKSEMNSLIEWILAWGAQHGVVFSEPEDDQPAPQGEGIQPEDTVGRV